MRINPSFFYNLTVSSLKERFLPSLTPPRQKMISVIALAVLAGFTLGCVVCGVIYKYVKKSDSPKEKKGDIQNIENHAEEKLNDGKKEGQNIPQEDPEQGLPMHKEQEKNLVQGLDSPTQDVVKDQDVVDQEIQVEPLQKEQELVSNKPKCTDFIRAAYVDLFFERNQLDEAQLEALTQKMKIAFENRHYQQDYNNDNPFLFCVDSGNFARENKVNFNNMEALIRYMILKDETYAYTRIFVENPKRIGFCIYLNKESCDNRAQIEQICFTKQKLEEADAFIESLIFPSLDNYDEKNRSVAQRIINLLKGGHHQRILNDLLNWEYCNLQTQYDHYPFVHQFMDQLVKQGVIHSWNIRNGFIAAKLKANDSIPEDPLIFEWNSWRDQAKLD